VLSLCGLPMTTTGHTVFAMFYWLCK